MSKILGMILATLLLAGPGRAPAQTFGTDEKIGEAHERPVEDDGPPSGPAAQHAVALREGETFYPVVRGRRGAVAAGNPFTVQAGFRLLVAGGNAVDAGVAMVLAGAMTEFDSYGFGGEVPILVYLADRGRVVAINGIGTAPAAVGPELFDPEKGIPGEGPLAAVVPSVLDNSVLALSRFGTRSFCEVSAPARELAEGFPMSEGLSRRIEGDAGTLRGWSSSARVFLPDGRAPRPGELFAQKDLAATLRALCAAEKRHAAQGRAGALKAVRDEFYRGPLGREFVRGARQAGGVLSEADLAAFQARVEEPVSSSYGDYRLFKPGYWTQGPALLHMLGLLSGFDLKAMGHNSADYIHVVTEAMKLAFADRDRWFGDPDFVKVPARGYLAPAYIKERAALIDPDHASLEQRPGDPWKYDAGPAGARDEITPAASGGAGRAAGGTGRGGAVSRDTTSMEAVDRAGNLFSATASGAWLPSVIAGATGIPMSERLESFLLEPGHPNVLAPRKRPRITLTPTVVLKNGRPWMALSTVGGDYQDQVILQVFLNLAVFGMNVQQAIEAPRFTTDHLVDSFAGHPFRPGTLNLEQRLFDDRRLVKALAAKGHTVKSTGSWRHGTAPTAILYHADDGVMEAGADPRHHRAAIAW
jgi:gamma-glutamyltranspeptidase/glutathione hydrolase